MHPTNANLASLEGLKGELQATDRGDAFEHLVAALVAIDHPEPRKRFIGFHCVEGKHIYAYHR